MEDAMVLRVARFACSCCGGHSSMPLPPGTRAPARRACGNGGCWPCLGACGGVLQRVEVVRMPGQAWTGPLLG